MLLLLRYNGCNLAFVIIFKCLFFNLSLERNEVVLILHYLLFNTCLDFFPRQLFQLAFLCVDVIQKLLALAESKGNLFSLSNYYFFKGLSLVVFRLYNLFEVTV
jgi:hypothetical protein